MKGKQARGRLKSELTSTATISDPGISNMASRRSFSRMALSPLAPVFLLMACRAIAFSAPSVKVRSTYRSRAKMRLA